uniref:(northern house mosquito) hypothetical protein n=1 Tax=Culex pipiens TaxID=7175 RepID=A0A8D8DDU2_CULPI
MWSLKASSLSKSVRQAQHVVFGSSKLAGPSNPRRFSSSSTSCAMSSPESCSDSSDSSWLQSEKSSARSSDSSSVRRSLAESSNERNFRSDSRHCSAMLRATYKASTQRSQQFVGSEAFSSSSVISTPLHAPINSTIEIPSTS